jgi:hypothetical protein
MGHSPKWVRNSHRFGGSIALAGAVGKAEKQGTDPHFRLISVEKRGLSPVYLGVAGRTAFA